MSKHITLLISDETDLHLRVLAAHTNATKAAAALAAMTAGIPAWVTTTPSGMAEPPTASYPATGSSRNTNPSKAPNSKAAAKGADSK